MSRNTKFAAILGGVLVVIVVAVLVVFVVLPGASPHFGFPSQQQASSSLGQNVTKSAVYTKSDNTTQINGITFYFDETQITYYNASHLVVTAGEIMFNSSAIATSFYSQLESTVGARMVNSSFTYDSVTVNTFSQSTFGVQLSYSLFHDGRFVCIVLMTNSSGHTINTVPFIKDVVSSVV